MKAVTASVEAARRQALMREYVAAYRRANKTTQQGFPVVKWERGWFLVTLYMGGYSCRYRKSEIEQMIRRLQARV